MSASVPRSVRRPPFPELTRLLLAWYDAHRRDLPWRRSRDPYAIWLSEVMLQQTTVRTVEPRWERFLQRWPTLKALAEAPLEDVLHEWTGLGYYARARNLHRAAGVVARDFGGALPGQYELLLALPGMGAYTAAAVASIAFGEAVAVVDANVERVLARLHAMPEDVSKAPAKRRLSERAQELLAADRPGDFNQAMMELGAVLCLPKKPRCRECPLAGACQAHRLGEAEAFPVKRARPPMEDSREAAVVLRRADGRFLILRRPEEGSFAGMWEVPRVVCQEGEESEAAALRAAQELGGIPATQPRLLFQLRHVVMRRRIELRVFEATCPDAPAVRTRLHTLARWVTPEQWAALPKSTTQADVAEMLQGGTPAPRRRVKAAGVGKEEADLFAPAAPEDPA